MCPEAGAQAGSKLNRRIVSRDPAEPVERIQRIKQRIERGCVTVLAAAASLALTPATLLLLQIGGIE